MECLSIKYVLEDIIVLTVYRLYTLRIAQFLLNLEKLIKYYRTLPGYLVCLGDFSEDARSVGPVQTFLRGKGFIQIVDFSTTEGATILDHVYLSSSMQANVEKIPTYYSYYDALIVEIKKQKIETVLISF